MLPWAAGAWRPVLWSGPGSCRCVNCAYPALGRAGEAVAALGLPNLLPTSTSRSGPPNAWAPGTMRRAASAAIWAALLLAGLSHAAAQVPPPQPPGGLQLNAPSNASPLLVPRRLVGFGRLHFFQIPGALPFLKRRKKEKDILFFSSRKGCLLSPPVTCTATSPGCHSEPIQPLCSLRTPGILLFQLIFVTSAGQELQGTIRHTGSASSSLACSAARGNRGVLPRLRPPQ